MFRRSCQPEPMFVGNEETNLLKLPVEILIKIFKYVGTQELLNNVRLTCKYIDKILDESFFKRRLRHYYKDSKIPPVTQLLGLQENGKWTPGSKVSWKSMCHCLQVKADVWKSISAFNSPLTKFHSISCHTACVDTVKIFNKGRLAVSGARDRSLLLWNIEEVPNCIGQDVDKHCGWIWDIETLYDDSCFSCDWSGDAILWSVTRGLHPVMRFSLNNPILCVAGVPEYYVVGLQRKEICFLDPRIGMSSQMGVKVHGAAVMDINIEGPYILSVSEDKTLAITDIRNLKIYKSFQVSENSPPVSLSKVNNLVYIADTSGSVKVINLNTDFEICMTLQTQQGRLTSICATPGILYSSSRNNYVTVSTISDPLITRADIFCGAEVTCVDYSHCVLAAARADNFISFFHIKPFF